jgi:glycosyltransferase involved in cell wall biosynthesis
MRKKKIIFFSVSGAGVKRNIIDIALNLDKEKYEVIGVFPDKLFSSVVRGDSQCTYKEIFNRAGLKCHILEIPRELSPLIDMKAVWHLRKILKIERPDIVHCHSSLAGALGRLAVLGLCKVKPKIVYTPHLMYYECSKGLKKSIYWCIEKLLWPLADAIIAVGRSEYEVLNKDFAPAKRLYRINNGIDVVEGVSNVSNAKERLSNELDIKGDSIFILSLARLEPQKDVLTLLKAFISVTTQQPDAVLLLAGGGTESQIKEAKRLIEEAGLSRRAFLLGWRDDIDLLLSAADIAVLSTNLEGLPYALLEAMAAEKPLVGSLAQGVVDCIIDGYNGYLFDVGDVESCAVYLTRLLRDPVLRRRLGAAGKEYALKNFSLKTMLNETEELYSKISLLDETVGK